MKDDDCKTDFFHRGLIVGEIFYAIQRIKVANKVFNEDSTQTQGGYNNAPLYPPFDLF